MDEGTDNLERDATIGGRYRVVRDLGKGGTGAVYEVLDEREGRQLALKLLLRKRAGPSSISAALFEREYHTLCQLAHPRIIEVFDYGIDAGRPFYTMELLDGHDVQSLGVLPWARVCALLCDVASSLAIMHSRRLVHRDVSARNVRCTGDGRAKLLDFGAMVSMGAARQAVGTPPYVAPEVLEMQALDGRADLYAVGALGYYLLTGYHAYEARSFAGLRAIWGSPPMLPGQYVEGIPATLDQLVMELLQLDRSARPSSAAEVMERLSGIAGRPLIDLPAVKRSYLVMPNLVGRELEVSSARKALAAMSNSGKGGALFIEGAAGVGRSRCLEACVLEARLQGVLVLRADAADSVEGGEYGALRTLCDQLWQADPELCERLAQRRAQSLSFLIPGLVAAEPSVPPGAVDEADAPETAVHAATAPAATAPSRSALLGAAQELLFGAARGRAIVIAVDDVHAIDEPSAALLGMVAGVIKQRPILVIVSSDSGAQQGPALAILRDAATLLLLAPLAAEQHEALLRSVFGDVANVTALAATLFELTGGTPRATMTLAEDLIERDLARYEAGRWSLPIALEASDLPRSISAALLQRLAGLSPQARKLADTLALVDPTTLPVDHYRALIGDQDSARVYGVLDELLAAGILARVGERFRFAQPALPHRLERELPEERKRLLHQRLALALQTAPLDIRVVRHRLLGGDERAAIEDMQLVYARTRLVQAQELQVLLTAVAAAKRLRIKLETRLQLEASLLMAAAAAGRRDLFFEPNVTELLAHCECDTGLRDYLELPDSMEPAARISEAVRRACARYQAAPDDERGFNPVAASTPVVRVHAAHSVMAAVAQDLELIERLPRLDAMRAHVRAWDLTQSSVDINRWVHEGRTTRALQEAATLVRSIDRQSGGLDSLSANLRSGALYVMATFAATSGLAEVGAFVAEFEQNPGLRSNAWRIRMVYELMQGNLAAAADCERRAELLNLQDSGRVQFTGSTARIELLAHLYAENLLGVKHVMERVAGLAARYPGWRPTLAVARCHYRRLQGDAAGALGELEDALRVQPGRHVDWWLIAYSHVKVLCDLERSEEAAAHGKRYVHVWRQEQLSSVDYGLQQVTAEALARAGRLDEARSMIERYISAHHQVGTRGLRIGLAYETAARIAMKAGDEHAVGRYTALCSAEYKGGRDLLLKAKLERLLQEAEQYGATTESPVVAAH